MSGGKLFFADSDDTHGRELWVSDGTAAGTTMVKDIWAGVGDIASEWYPNYDPPPSGAICSCLTSLGTYYHYGANGSSPSHFIESPNGVIFAASDDQGRWLYLTDGTPEGTVRLNGFG